METIIQDLGNIGIVVADWDIDKSYPTRTLTTDYSSWITYISRKPVPANTPITDDRYWKPIMRLQSDIVIDYNDFKDTIIKKVNSLNQIVKSVIETSGGVALSNEFGTEELIGVSQKSITEAFARIWQKLEDMTGEALTGINMTVTPKFFISEEGCNVHITATTVEAEGIFEHIAFYANDELIVEADNVDYLTHEAFITDTTVIKCVAKIMGIEYTRQRVITHYNSFWLGAGETYSDIMDEEHVVPLKIHMRGQYNVPVEDGQHILIVVGSSFRDGYLRADMNGFEIPFTESEVELEGTTYKVFTSVNTYQAGTYRINING